MELETSKLILIKTRYNLNLHFSFKKDIKRLNNFLRSLLGLINVFLTLFLFMFFLFIRLISFLRNFDYIFLKDKISNLEKYQNIQNNFCDNIRNLYIKEFEDKLNVVNVFINEKKFDMFIYNNLIINQLYENETTLNLLNALKYYIDKYDYEEDDILIIDISYNAGLYTNFFGILQYSILSFEPLIENYYISKKNFCRNIKSLNSYESTITIVNKAVYPVEKFCNYYKDIKNIKKDQILCDISKEKKLDKDYIKIGTIKTIQLREYFPLLNKRITLLILDLELEGEMALESGKELIDKYHIPFVFIKFNIRVFKFHETNSKNFLLFFIQNGYKISLNGFLTNEFISVDDLLKIKFIIIHLYIIYIGD